MQFQLSWNPLPTNMEQESNLAVTRRELKKLTTKAYRVGNERWQLRVGRVSGVVVIGCGTNRLEDAMLVSNVMGIWGDRNSLCQLPHSGC